MVSDISWNYSTTTTKRALLRNNCKIWTALAFYNIVCMCMHVCGVLPRVSQAYYAKLLEVVDVQGRYLWLEQSFHRAFRFEILKVIKTKLSIYIYNSVSISISFRCYKRYYYTQHNMLREYNNLGPPMIKLVNKLKLINGHMFTNILIMQY